MQKENMSLHGGHEHGYSGLTAELYDAWFSVKASDDHAFFKRHIEKEGGLALEIGSGTGRLLVPYLLDGLHVHGVEPSVEMNAICASKANKHNITPTVYRQYMEVMNIPVSYKTIFVPLCLFQIIEKRDSAFETLRRFYLHLDKGGHVLISLYTPSRKLMHYTEGMWRVRSSMIRQSDHAQVVLSESVACNYFDQIETQWLKYEICKQDGSVETTIKTTNLRWYHKYEFMMMLEHVGFKDIKVFGDYTDHAATGNSDVLIFSGKK